MSQDKVFANGMIVKDRGNAPEWVIAKVSIKVEEFIQTLQQHADNGWVNLNIQRSRGGKDYVEIDTWKPNQDNPANQGYATRQEQPQRQAPPPPPAPFPADDNLPGLDSEPALTQKLPFDDA
jgi:hypothetical protein